MKTVQVQLIIWATLVHPGLYQVTQHCKRGEGKEKGNTRIQGGTDRYSCLMCTCAVIQRTGCLIDTCVDICLKVPSL